jgi:transposase-like protein
MARVISSEITLCEVFMKTNGLTRYLWRAVDREGGARPLGYGKVLAKG